jgi:hypothetical protein
LAVPTSFPCALARAVEWHQAIVASISDGVLRVSVVTNIASGGGVVDGTIAACVGASWWPDVVVRGHTGRGLQLLVVLVMVLVHVVLLRVSVLALIGGWLLPHVVVLLVL